LSHAALSHAALSRASSSLPGWASVLLVSGLVALRRRRWLRLGAIATVAVWMSGCGGSDGSKTPALAGDAGPAGSGGGGEGGSSAGGAGGGMSAGGSVSPSGGASGTAGPSLPGAAPATFVCQGSRQCSVDEWCNPANSACEPRSLPGEALSFAKQIFPTLQGLGCAGCHSPGERGDVDPSGSGVNLLLHEVQRGYRSLVAGGVNCQGGPKRLCVDDPASSRLIRQVLAGQSSSPESIAFTTWTDPQLQEILRWIASGAPRDSLCGNFVRDPGEACDEGPTPATRCAYGLPSCNLCNTSCLSVPSGPGPSCGDGVLDVARETCDPAIAESGPYGSAECGSDCTYVAP
jgi:hypothetical protein